MEEKVSHSLKAYIDRQSAENLKRMWVDCRLGRSADGVMELVEDALRRKGCSIPVEGWTDGDGQSCGEQGDREVLHRLFLRIDK